VGIIGCGYIGNKRANIASKHGFSELVSVADLDKSRAVKAAKTYQCRVTDDWRQITCSNNIDIVVVSTTNNSLAEISLSALKNKKHVLCEKPMARSYAEAYPLINMAKKQNVILKVGLSLRYHPAIVAARKLLNKNIIGETMFIRCRYGHGGRPGYDREWRAKKEISGGGELLDQGIHITDLFHWFMGDFKEAMGFSVNNFWQTDGIEDNAFALFKTNDNKVASMHVSWTQWKNIFSFEIFGKKGYLNINGLGGSYGVEKLVVGLGAANGCVPQEKTVRFENSGDCWKFEWDEFLQAIANNHQPVGNGADAVKALQMIDAVYLSSEEGRATTIESYDTSRR